MKKQVLVYLAAVTAGLVTGATAPGIASLWERLVWPALGLLLYATFTQVPLLELRKAAAEGRFLAAAITGNFAVLPVVVWLLVVLAPENAAIRLGIAIVLLAPCTDWFVTFTHLGKGDTGKAIALLPVSLLMQMALLPVYLWALFGAEFTVDLAQSQILSAFLFFVLVPLLAALATENWAKGSGKGRRWLGRLGVLPGPLLALVVFLVAASQVEIVMNSSGFFGALLILFTAFLAIAAGLAYGLARVFKLPPKQGRVLAFSFGTRNSFVVLPLALALPDSFEEAAVVIVFQSLVELFGMMAYLRYVLNALFPIRS